jgi:hypothetical protein
MYGSRTDAAQGIVVGLFWGDTNTDDDYRRYVDSLVEADRGSPPEIAKTVILVVDRGNPAPPAQWRKRIADATERIRSKHVLFVLCAESPLIRGVVTAINWIRPPRYDVQVVSSPDAMLAVLAQRRSSAEEPVRRMLAELRVAARRSIPPL